MGNMISCPLGRVLTYKNLIHLLNLQICEIGKFVQTSWPQETRCGLCSLNSDSQFSSQPGSNFSDVNQAQKQPVVKSS